MPGEGQQSINMVPAGRTVRSLGIANILDAQAQMEGGIEALRSRDHVLGRQKRDQMRGPMAFQGIAKAGQRADQKTGHGWEDSTLQL